MNETRPKHFKPLNQEAPREVRERPATAEPRLPLSACDCDEHCNVDICVVDDVDADACGMYGG